MTTPLEAAKEELDSAVEDYEARWREEGEDGVLPPAVQRMQVAQAKYESLKPHRAPICPECRSGKHRNCDGSALDERADDLVECRCPPAFHPEKRSSK